MAKVVHRIDTTPPILTCAAIRVMAPQIMGTPLTFYQFLCIFLGRCSLVRPVPCLVTVKPRRTHERLAISHDIKPGVDQTRYQIHGVYLGILVAVVNLPDMLISPQPWAELLTA